jgi:peptidyl-prolyl cis-trans isomerase SurA
LRSLREVASTQQAPATLEYAVLEAAAGDAILTRAAQNADTCDDLYGVAKDQTGATLWFDEGTPSEIESDIALVLAGLDPDEYSTALSRNGGQTQLFVMLCSRLATGTVAMDRTTIENQIRTQQLTGFADRLLADLRAQAVIIDQ